MKGYFPVIGIVCCNKNIEGHPSQAVHNKFINAVTCVGGATVLLPSQLANGALTRALDKLSGVLLTGSLSNVAPARYAAVHIEEKEDLLRDALTFSTLDYALEHDLPLLGICRGHQELNVALGGTLHPKLHDVVGHMDHREDGEKPLEEQYALAHEIKITGEWLQQISGSTHAQVNSLHGQGIKDLGAHLNVQAVASDGVIECIKSEKHTFAVGIQWHPEWQTEQNALSVAIFNAFIEAASEER